jgi:arylsulfatase A-like enzyme
LIVRYPTLFPPGTRLSGLAQPVDLLPTIIETVGLPRPSGEGISTHSLVPRSFEPRQAVFSEVYPLPMDLGRMQMRADGKAELLSDLTAHQRAIRTEQFRYVRYSDGRTALYDLGSDPHEELNLVEQLPDVAQDLSDRLEAWWEAQPRYVADATQAAEPISDEVLEQLHALGYVE